MLLLLVLCSPACLCIWVALCRKLGKPLRCGSCLKLGGHCLLLRGSFGGDDGRPGEAAEKRRS